MGVKITKLMGYDSDIQTMSWSLDESRQAVSNSPFSQIPDEILLQIFRYLSVPDLCNVGLVCRLFKILADCDEIWKYKSNTSAKLLSKSYRQMYMEWISRKVDRQKKLLSNWGTSRYHGRTACIVYMPPQYPRRPFRMHDFESIAGFQQHPNATSDLTIKFSVDIDQSACQLVGLLEKAIRSQQNWEKSVIIKQMIQRYYRFMQLKASQSSDTLLIPTIDIEIIWQTHLLRPEMYRKDCLRLFRRVIDHSLILKDDIGKYFKRQAFLDTCQLYKDKFGEEYCTLPTRNENDDIPSDRWLNNNDDDDDDYYPILTSRITSVYSYWDVTSYKFSSTSPMDYENPFSFTEADVILDLKWFDQCKLFMSNTFDKIAKQVRYLPKPTGIDLRQGSLNRLKKSYERFLYMAVKYPIKDGNGFIPPTYAIDIIWHSHMQEPLNYEADCLRLVGYVIYHDPWPIIEEENMTKTCDQIDQIWKDEFQCELETDHLMNA